MGTRCSEPFFSRLVPFLSTCFPLCLSPPAPLGFSPSFSPPPPCKDAALWTSLELSPCRCCLSRGKSHLAQRLSVPHCPPRRGPPQGTGAPFKLPKREAGCPHPGRDGLGTWRCGRTHPLLHSDRAEARIHAGTQTRGHAQRHT